MHIMKTIHGFFKVNLFFNSIFRQSYWRTLYISHWPPRLLIPPPLIFPSHYLNGPLIWFSYCQPFSFWSMFNTQWPFENMSEYSCTRAPLASFLLTEGAVTSPASKAWDLSGLEPLSSPFYLPLAFVMALPNTLCSSHTVWPAAFKHHKHSVHKACELPKPLA